MPDFMIWVLIAAIGGLFSYFKNRHEKSESSSVQPKNVSKQTTIDSDDTEQKQWSRTELGRDQLDEEIYTRRDDSPYGRQEEQPYERETKKPYERREDTPYNTPREWGTFKKQTPANKYRRLIQHNLADGIVLSEILEKPRAKRPHQVASQYKRIK